MKNKDRIEDLEIQVETLKDVMYLNAKKDFDFIGAWFSAALSDPNVCAEMKKDLENWFSRVGSIIKNFEEKYDNW